MDRTRFTYIGDRAKSAAKTGPPIDTVKKMRGKLWKRWRLIVPIALIILLAMGGLTYAYLDARADLQKLSKTGNSQEEMLQTISRHLAVPKEEPTVATVNDAVKLNSQEFFKDAQNGDKVFIFPKANRALIYRPSTQKVIEYA